MVQSAAPPPPSTLVEGGLRAASSWVKVESPLRTPLGGRGLLRALQPSPRLCRLPQSGEEPPSRLKISSCLLAAAIVGLWGRTAAHPG